MRPQQKQAARFYGTIFSKASSDDAEKYSKEISQSVGDKRGLKVVRSAAKKVFLRQTNQKNIPRGRPNSAFLNRLFRKSSLKELKELAADDRLGGVQSLRELGMGYRRLSSDQRPALTDEQRREGFRESTNETDSERLAREKMEIDRLEEQVQDIKESRTRDEEKAKRVGLSQPAFVQSATGPGKGQMVIDEVASGFEKTKSIPKVLIESYDNYQKALAADELEEARKAHAQMVKIAQARDASDANAKMARDANLKQLREAEARIEARYQAQQVEKRFDADYERRVQEEISKSGSPVSKLSDKELQKVGADLRQKREALEKMQLELVDQAKVEGEDDDIFQDVMEDVDESTLAQLEEERRQLQLEAKARTKRYGELVKENSLALEQQEAADAEIARRSSIRKRVFNELQQIPEYQRFEEFEEALPAYDELIQSDRAAILAGERTESALSFNLRNFSSTVTSLVTDAKNAIVFKGRQILNMPNPLRQNLSEDSQYVLGVNPEVSIGEDIRAVGQNIANRASGAWESARAGLADAVNEGNPALMADRMAVDLEASVARDVAAGGRYAGAVSRRGTSLAIGKGLKQLGFVDDHLAAARQVDDVLVSGGSAVASGAAAVRGSRTVASLAKIGESGQQVVGAIGRGITGETSAAEALGSAAEGTFNAVAEFSSGTQAAVIADAASLTSRTIGGIAAGAAEVLGLGAEAAAAGAAVAGVSAAATAAAPVIAAMMLAGAVAFEVYDTVVNPVYKYVPNLAQDKWVDFAASIVAVPLWPAYIAELFGVDTGMKASDILESIPARHQATQEQLNRFHDAVVKDMNMSAEEWLALKPEDAHNNLYLHTQVTEEPHFGFLNAMKCGGPDMYQEFRKRKGFDDTPKVRLDYLKELIQFVQAQNQAKEAAKAEAERRRQLRQAPTPVTNNSTISVKKMDHSHRGQPPLKSTSSQHFKEQTKYTDENLYHSHIAYAKKVIVQNDPKMGPFLDTEEGQRLLHNFVTAVESSSRAT